MKSSCVLLVLASVLVVGCAGSSPLAPDSVSGSNARSSASTSQSFFPPIDPVGISCPTDAPGLRASSIGARMDIEFAEVAGATAYEIEIMSYTGVKHRLEVPAPAYRAEWYGIPGLYRIKIRTINCGGVGNWSADVFHTLDDNTPPPVKPPQPPVPPPTPGPQCMDEGCAPPTPGPQCMDEGCQPPPPPCMDECGPSDYLRRR
jgi:hypothetical protein